jgi:hypothetical protein
LSAIAIIGWGSLLWDLDNLSPFVVGDWSINAGPWLPLEFSLVSRKRLGALALAIDEKHGAYSPSSIILSMHSDIIAARSDLAARERTALNAIGFIDLVKQSDHSISLTTKTLIFPWLKQSGLQGAVWTDSPPNFENHTSQSFSVENAKRYLRSLSKPCLREAKRYITNAPVGVQSPLRLALAQETWWRDVIPL